jgi:hypothetical protein
VVDDDSRAVAAAAAGACGAAYAPMPPRSARPELALSATVVDLGRLLQYGRSPERRVGISNAGAGDLNAQATTSASWLKLLQDGDELVVAADTSAPGEYKGIVTIDSDGGTATIHVHAHIDPAPTAATTEPEPVPGIPKDAPAAPQQHPALTTNPSAMAPAVGPLTETAPSLANSAAAQAKTPHKIWPSEDSEASLLREMATFPRRLRSGYRIKEIQQWVAAVGDPELREGDNWPDAPTTPRFSKQVPGLNPKAVDAFTARHTPFAPSAMYGDGRTLFAAKLRAMLKTESLYRDAAELSDKKVARLRRQLRLPDAEHLAGGIICGVIPTEYFYFTDWGLRARGGNGQLLSIPYSGFPSARFEEGVHRLEYVMPLGLEDTEPKSWLEYGIDIFFCQKILTILLAPSGKEQAARVARWLNSIKSLCSHCQPDGSSG